jgi:hypothetical protein
VNMIRLKAPTDGGTVSVEGIQHQIVDGFVEVRAEHFEQLKSHGFYDPRNPPPNKVAERGINVAVPRLILERALKQLGIAAATTMTDEQMVVALEEASRRQAERLAYEVNQARRRPEEPNNPTSSQPAPAKVKRERMRAE